MSHWNSSTTSMESPQPMDLSSDEKGPRRKIFVKTCPYCKDEYVIPRVFVSHLAGHIQFHSDLNLFKCTICDLVDRSSTVVALHVETHHAVKRSIFLDSARAKLITNRNLIERDGMISVLGKNDDSSKKLLASLLELQCVLVCLVGFYDSRRPIAQAQSPALGNRKP